MEWNRRMTWVGKDHKDQLVPTPGNCGGNGKGMKKQFRTTVRLHV